MTEPLLHIVLFEPEIPHNTGAIGRTCVALGAKLWLVRPMGFQINDRSLKRAGMDYWESLNWETANNWQQLVENVSAQCTDAGIASPQFRLITKFASTMYTQCSYAPGDVLVFGRESSGLPKYVHDQFPSCGLKIPMSPLARSLNVSVSVGIVAYEAVRQINLGQR